MGFGNALLPALEKFHIKIFLTNHQINLFSKKLPYFIKLLPTRELHF